MSDMGGGVFRGTLSPNDCTDDPEFFFTVNNSACGIVTTPGNAPANVFTALAGNEFPVLADDFETNLGWTTQVIGATSGNWQRGIPVNDSGWAHDPVSDSDGSGRCYLTQNAAGNTDVDGGAVALLSPVIDMTAGDMIIAYDYYLKLTDEDGTDRLLVELSSNGTGGPFTEIARHDTDGGLDWRSHLILEDELILAGIPLTTTMVVRFTANDGDVQSIVEAGVDAFRASSVPCGGVGLVYCTSGTTANGCRASISGMGSPSGTAGSGFDIIVSQMEGSKSGLIFYSINGANNFPWGAGTSLLCTKAPTQRSPIQNSGGSNGSCDGQITLDWNLFIATRPNALGNPFTGGESVWAQGWFRDPPSPKTTSLSNGLQFTVAP